MFATHRTWPHSRGVRCRRRSLTGDICAWQIAYGGAPHAHAGNSEEEEERRGMMIKVRNEGSRDEEKPMRGEGLRMRARPRRRAKRPRAAPGEVRGTAAMKKTGRPEDREQIVAWQRQRRERKKRRVKNSRFVLSWAEIHMLRETDGFSFYLFLHCPLSLLHLRIQQAQAQHHVRMVSELQN